MPVRATGYCFTCGEPVPEYRKNKYYCNEGCRAIARIKYLKEKEENNEST